MADPAMTGPARYERLPNDAYYTEDRVTDGLIDSYCLRTPIWEPAEGRGDMKKRLIERGFWTDGSDITNDPPLDFLETEMIGASAGIVTNPPYSLSDEFVRHAISLAEPEGGYVAMLLRNEWDCARKRLDLANRITMKIVLTFRPRWDWWLPKEEQGKGGARHNFSWYVWDFGWSPTGSLEGLGRVVYYSPP